MNDTFPKPATDDVVEVALTPENRAEALRAVRRFRAILSHSPLNLELESLIKKEKADFSCGTYFMIDKGQSYEHRQPTDFVEKIHRWLDEKGISANP